MVLLLVILLFAPGASFADQRATTEDGRKVILKDDGTWVPQESDAEERGRSDGHQEVYQVIRTHCKTEWPGDFRMRARCEQQQREALEKLRVGKPEDIRQEEYAVVKKKCAADWPMNYRMRHYCEEQQFKAVRDLKKP